ncbi:MAG: MgtC/SapB family protein [Candidatus Omnitrophica bacterium]|nr:MgtC/SapB family protein [Candidatus Omnitrophota bacterium]
MEYNILEVFGKLCLTIILSSLIGAEREFRQKGAGLRTHILVGVGSALIVLTSFHIFDIYKDVAVVDPTRMMSSIVQGIGFLCAGTIIRSGGERILGLTTAATLWIVSGIGMAVGAGQYTTAILFSVVVFVVLIGLRSFEQKLKDKVVEPK